MYPHKWKEHMLRQQGGNSQFPNMESIFYACTCHSLYVWTEFIGFFSWQNKNHCILEWFFPINILFVRKRVKVTKANKYIDSVPIVQLHFHYWEDNGVYGKSYRPESSNVYKFRFNLIWESFPSLKSYFLQRNV